MSFKSLSNNTTINVEEKVIFGNNIVFGPNCLEVEIGYGCFLGRDLYIDCEYLTIGEYTTIHHGSIIHGRKCSIGHNCWFGHYTIIDSLGGNTKIGNNVGVGAHSQLWSHIKFGDVLEGSRWNSSGSLILEDDVWLVGHCITGPIHAQKKSMLMTGSVAVKDMLPNRIYAGNPAKDMSEKFGAQFTDLPLSKKKSMFNNYLISFQKIGNEVGTFLIVDKFEKGKYENGFSQFNLSTRQYWPQYSEVEYTFMRYLLYDKAKFFPYRPRGEK